MRQFNINPKATPTFEGILRWIRNTATSITGFFNEIESTVPRKLSVNNSAVGNVGTGEDDLITYTLPADTLYQVGSGVRITAWGTAANNGGTKTLKTYFGSQVIATDSLTASQVDVWKVVAIVWRTGSSTQDYESEFLQSGTQTQVVLESGSATQNQSTDLTIKCTGEATNDNDIVQEGLLVEFLP